MQRQALDPGPELTNKPEYLSLVLWELFKHRKKDLSLRNLTELIHFVTKVFFTHELRMTKECWKILVLYKADRDASHDKFSWLWSFTVSSFYNSKCGSTKELKKSNIHQMFHTWVVGDPQCFSTKHCLLWGTLTQGKLVSQVPKQGFSFGIHRKRSVCYCPLSPRVQENPDYMGTEGVLMFQLPQIPWSVLSECPEVPITIWIWATWRYWKHPHRHLNLVLAQNLGNLKSTVWQRESKETGKDQINSLPQKHHCLLLISLKAHLSDQARWTCGQTGNKYGGNQWFHGRRMGKKGRKATEQCVPHGPEVGVRGLPFSISLCQKNVPLNERKYINKLLFDADSGGSEPPPAPSKISKCEAALCLFNITARKSLQNQPMSLPYWTGYELPPEVEQRSRDVTWEMTKRAIKCTSSHNSKNLPYFQHNTNQHVQPRWCNVEGCNAWEQMRKGRRYLSGRGKPQPRRSKACSW